ncbi:MAG TPA: SDR family oxidoreductase [Gemmatimonadales bacterium]
MSQIGGSTVLVTGGASGIGYLTGRKLLAKGAQRLVIWDIQKAALERVAAELTGEGYQVDGYQVDIADPARVEATVQEMDAAGIAVDLLVNNAGIIVGKPFIDHTPADIGRTMDVNALAPMYLTHALLPGMVARGRGHVVNISSAASMVSNPRMSVYCASKWALTGWSDSLRLEMERACTGVRVTTVTTYYIDTGMFAGVRSPLIPILEPERVTDDIVAAIERDRIFLRLPHVVNFLPLLRGILPLRWFDRIAGDWLGIYDTMTGFRGRT